MTLQLPIQSIDRPINPFGEKTLAWFLSRFSYSNSPYRMYVYACILGEIEDDKKKRKGKHIALPVHNPHSDLADCSHPVTVTTILAAVL